MTASNALFPDLLRNEDLPMLPEEIQTPDPKQIDEGRRVRDGPHPSSSMSSSRYDSSVRNGIARQRSSSRNSQRPSWASEAARPAEHAPRRYRSIALERTIHRRPRMIALRRTTDLSSPCPRATRSSRRSSPSEIRSVITGTANTGPCQVSSPSAEGRERKWNRFADAALPGRPLAPAPSRR